MFQDKELNCHYPKPRSNKTFDKTDIFFRDKTGNYQSPQKKIQNNSSSIFDCEQQSQSAIQSKVRLSPTHFSSIFSIEKENNGNKGIRTYDNHKKQMDDELQGIQSKPNPFKTKDTPINYFYPIEEKSDPFQGKQSPKSNDKINLNTNISSEIQRDIIIKKKMELEKNQKFSEIYPVQCTWDKVHQHDVAKVNEQVIFDQDYSKMRKQAENASSALPQSYHKSPEIIPIKNNLEIKKNNQNFSDLFGQEYGSLQRPKRVRSISPSLNWAQHDSIRNKQDFGENEQEGQKSRKLYQDDFCETHMMCQKTFKQIKSKDRGNEGNLNDVPKIVQILSSDKTQYWKKNNQQYTGIYSWKINYPKKK